MPANIEVKARVTDPDGFRKRAELLSDACVEVIPQEDVFFRTRSGRLKLRLLGPDRGELIWYIRPDTAGPKHSEYRICPVPDPDDMRSLLASAIGVRGIVRKTRFLYLSGQTRIHLDSVEGLGWFMELEVVLRPGQPGEEGRLIATRLMEELGIDAQDLIEGAYIDLIEQS